MLKIFDAAFRAQGPSIDMTCSGGGGREQGGCIWSIVTVLFCGDHPWGRRDGKFLVSIKVFVGVLWGCIFPNTNIEPP